MRNAETILTVIRERGKQGLPLERIYRLLFNRELFLLAYGRIAKNSGALTPGVTAETADGMTMAKIDAIIEALRFERYRWTPARRIYIEKKDSKKKRPLGLPTWSDKLVQEVIRLILDAYYEPQFSDHSHGFRTGRGCHTALKEVYYNWRATAWFIEGDISRCFDALDHEVLLGILREKLHDERFLRLLDELLRAGYFEEWRFNATLSGVPQGGVASPVLANIYLDRLDRFVEQVLFPAYNRGTHRKDNRAYHRLMWAAQAYRKRGDCVTAATLMRRAQQMPSKDPDDPGYRRLRYVRYADDFLLAFSGPRTEAEEIKAKIGEFLRDTLKLELSAAKTLISHARTEAARFLGYEVTILQNDRKHTRGRRSINGAVGLKVPDAVIQEKCRPYMDNGIPTHRKALTHNDAFSIIAQYQNEYVGVVNYYRLAFNLHRLARLRWTTETSLVKTLANKYKASAHQMYRRFETTVGTPDGPRKVLRVVVERDGGRSPLVAVWGGVSLKWRMDAILDDQPQPSWSTTRTELLERLLADTCELCGSQEDVQVHHIRKLRHLERRGRAPKPEWVRVMAARHRKTLVVCRPCHARIDHGLPLPHGNAK